MAWYCATMVGAFQQAVPLQGSQHHRNIGRPVPRSRVGCMFDLYGTKPGRVTSVCGAAACCLVSSREGILFGDSSSGLLEL